MSDQDTPGPSDGRKTLADLLAVMAALRTPGSGCPWDLAQTFATIAPYTLEEAYEVADAIERGDLGDLKEELGDLLLQVVYHARMAEEQGAFDFGDVAHSITAKMIRRHPHVFGDATARSAADVDGLWARIKAEEKAAKGKTEVRTSLLDDVPVAMPALVRAVKLQHKAAKVGFDWPSLAPVFEKMREELAELEDACGWGVLVDGQDRGALSLENLALEHPARGGVPGPGVGVSDREPIGSAPSGLPVETGITERESDGAIQEEFGDLLFVMANVARHLKIDPEAALRAANAKFTRRFHYIEARLAEDGRTPAQSSLAEMDRLWDEVRAADKAAQAARASAT